MEFRVLVQIFKRDKDIIKIMPYLQGPNYTSLELFNKMYYYELIPRVIDRKNVTAHIISFHTYWMHGFTAT